MEQKVVFRGPSGKLVGKFVDVKTDDVVVLCHGLASRCGCLYMHVQTLSRDACHPSPGPRPPPQPTSLAHLSPHPTPPPPPQ